MLNIEFQPIVAPRNYAPTRTFVTKWDVEIDNNRAKKIARRRDRDTKYFDDFEHVDLPTITPITPITPIIPITPIRVRFNDEHIDIWEFDHDGEQTRQDWLRSIRAENEYYDRQPIEIIRKRLLFSDEESDFKRVRA